MGAHAGRRRLVAVVAAGGFVTSSPTGLSGTAAGYVFAIGGDGGVWSQRIAGGSWTAWQSLGGRSPTPVAATWRDGEPMLAVLGLDQAVWTLRMTGGAWRGWRSLGGRSYPGVIGIHRDEVLLQDTRGDLVAHRVPY